MVLCAQPNAQADPLPISELLEQSNNVSQMTFDDVFSTF
jgi:hypothetical protein